MSNKHKIDSLFKEGLKNYAPQPPAHLWDNIASGVAAEKKRKKVAFIWWSVAASVAVLLSVGSAVFFWPQSYDTIEIAQISQSDDAVLSSSEDTTTPTQNADNENIKASRNINSDTNTSYKPQNRVASHEPAVAMAYASHDNRAALMAMQSAYFTDTYSDDASHSTSDDMLTPRGVMLSNNFNAASVNESTLASKAQNEAKRAHTVSLLNAPSLDGLANRNDVKSNQRIVVAAVANPAYSKNDDNRLTNHGRMPAASQSGLLALGGGLNVRMHTNSRWSFESGVVYNKIGQNEKAGTRNPVMLFSSSNAFSDNNRPEGHYNSMGIIKTKKSPIKNVQRPTGALGVASAPSRYAGYQGDIRQVLDYVEIPLMARYTLLDKLINVSVTGGFSANILADNNAFMFENSSKIYVGYTEDIENFAVSSALGLNVELPLYRSLYFNMEPRLKYFLSPVNSATGFYPYTFSVLAGVAIHF